jgi:sortase A
MVRLATTFERRLRPGQPLGRMRIGRLDESYVVVEGTSASALRRGPGRYPSGSVPGLDGTFGVAGHRTSWSAPFRRIDELRAGDRITVTMPYGRFTYVVTTRRIVAPEDVWVLRERSKARLVLTACHPLFSAAKRIVVSAELRSATPLGAALRAG